MKHCSINLFIIHKIELDKSVKLGYYTVSVSCVVPLAHPVQTSYYVLKTSLVYCDPRVLLSSTHHVDIYTPRCDIIQCVSVPPAVCMFCLLIHFVPKNVSTIMYISVHKSNVKVFMFDMWYILAVIIARWCKILIWEFWHISFMTGRNTFYIIFSVVNQWTLLLFRV